MKSLTSLVSIVAIGIMALVWVDYADACGGRLQARRDARHSTQESSGNSACAPSGTTFQYSAGSTFSTTTGTCPNGVCPTGLCPNGVCPVPNQTQVVGSPFAKPAKSNAEIEKELSAFTASTKCPTKAKAVIEHHLALHSLTKGAKGSINWAQLLADIEVAAPEVLAIVQEIISGLSN